MCLVPLLYNLNTYFQIFRYQILKQREIGSAALINSRLETGSPECGDPDIFALSFEKLISLFGYILNVFSALILKAINLSIIWVGYILAMAICVAEISFGCGGEEADGTGFSRHHRFSLAANGRRRSSL